MAPLPEAATWCWAWPPPGCTPTATRWCGPPSRRAAWRLDRPFAEVAARYGVAVAPGCDGHAGRGLADAHDHLCARTCLRSSMACAAAGLRLAGLAHITGGGLPGNLPRAVAAGLGIRVDPAGWPVPTIVALMAAVAGLDAREMRATFNGGIGMAAVVEPDAVDAGAGAAGGARHRRLGHRRGLHGRPGQPRPLPRGDRGEPRRPGGAVRARRAPRASPCWSRGPAATCVPCEPSSSAACSAAPSSWCWPTASVRGSPSQRRTACAPRWSGHPTTPIAVPGMLPSRLPCAPRASTWWCWRASCACSGRPSWVAWPERILNVHPSLLPAYPGRHAIADALAGGAALTGVTRAPGGRDARRRTHRGAAGRPGAAQRR